MNFGGPGQYSSARRLGQIRERLRELRARSSELDGSADGGPPATGLVHSAARAGQAASRRDRATEATIAAYASAGEAHERAAALHEYLAEIGIGDVERHLDRARVHHGLADEDRTAAARLRADSRTHRT
ncbi:hypothetical protein AGRA3207_002751 [Actinomadura graeca]|uniref:Uncharacterized protein n=1 Tax=Actinomadura graeca TaxID=2750812 RepID=A0ABX8QV42_9ACTN|nr:hypothetical protein [Actinomadura graeca]QXJ21849.1 hypothetical protein AGRA3207_002751 [Actinomadura graeca]